MEVLIVADPQRAAELTAGIVAQALRAKPDLVLGLATGRTMAAVHAALVALHRQAGLSFARAHSFNLDEYIGLAGNDRNSYRQTMTEQLFRHVDLPADHGHLLDGLAPDLAAECAGYEARIQALGGIDLQLLGLGGDGHIGFNEPLSALRSRTREKALSRATLNQNAALFGGDPGRVPRRALTMGVATILEARRCVLLATGADKAEILAQAVEGPLTAMVTASALQLHPCCQVVVDEAAAARLRGAEDYRWVFAHEPEWAPFRHLAGGPAPGPA